MPNPWGADGPPPRGAILAAAGAVAAAWCVVWWRAVFDGTLSVAGVLGAVLPLVLIALAAVLLCALRDLRAETDRLRIERDRLAAALKAPPGRADGPEPAPRGPAADAPAPSRPVPPPARQAPLPLAQGAAPAPDLAVPDLIRALHFPETPQDREGLRALRRALRDHKARLVVQAAQDMLTLLSQDGIYVDDLDPVRAGTDVWRRFAKGERGAAVAAVGGIHAPAELATCRDKLRGNTVYRDAAHHFLRRFDQTLGELAPRLDDDGLTALSETRSARAFMLVGRAAGVFGVPDAPDAQAGPR